MVPAKQRLGSRWQITNSHAQNKSQTKVSSIPEQEAQNSLKSYIIVEFAAFSRNRRGIHCRLGPKGSNIRERLGPKREIAKEDLEKRLRLPCHTQASWSGGHESEEGKCWLS